MLFIELAPGDYELAIVYKNPVTENLKQFKKLLPNSVRYQLTVIIHDKIDRQQLLPSSLNYFGMLGPYGGDYGRMAYFCQECVMENAEFKIIAFTSVKDFNFDAIISSPDNSIEVRLEKVNATV